MPVPFVNALGLIVYDSQTAVPKPTYTRLLQLVLSQARPRLWYSQAATTAVF